MSTWDHDMTKAALVEVLWATREAKMLSTSFVVVVAKDVQVTSIDLLSVLGVPYVVVNDDMLQVRLGAWMINSLLQGRTVTWTTEETFGALSWVKTTGEKVIGTFAVAEAAGKAGSKAYVYATTVAVTVTCGLSFFKRCPFVISYMRFDTALRRKI